MDKYRNFKELSLNEQINIDYTIESNIDVNQNICIIAPHGGGLEGGTSEICKSVAENMFNYYCFNAMKSSGNSILHITSSRFDEPICESIVEQSNVTVAFHGEKSKESIIKLGGKDRNLILLCKNELNKVGFNVIIDDSSSMAGIHEKNIVNRNRRSMGLQIELSQGFRNEIIENHNKRNLRQPKQSQKDKYNLFINTMKMILLYYSINL